MAGETERIHNLIIAMCENAIGIASTMLSLADPCPNLLDHPDLYFQEIRDELNQLEAQRCALLRYSGVSWDALAGYQGISRQAMHRRLSAAVDEALENTQAPTRFDTFIFEQRLEGIGYFVDHFHQDFSKELDQSLKTWSRRRRTAGWWHNREEFKREP